MKKSRIAKFALLGASAAALAATLSTSTYAWYVSNKTATIDEYTGTTASAVADGSIRISWTGDSESYYKDLSWDDDDADDDHMNALAPAHFVSQAGATYTFHDVSEGAEDGYIQFSMYIIADKDNTTVTPTITIENKTSSTTLNAIKQIAYNGDCPVDQGKSFVCDALDAMYVGLSENDAATKWKAAPTAGKLASGTNASNGKAHVYYQHLVGALPTNFDSPVSTSSTWSTLTVGTTAKKLTWTIFLDGGDVDCWNSCGGQTFDISLSFQA